MGLETKDGSVLLDDRRKGNLWVWDLGSGSWVAGAEGVKMLQRHHKACWRRLVGLY